MLGYSCIASGLRGSDGSLIGIIGVTGRTGSFAAKRLTRPLLAAASDMPAYSPPNAVHRTPNRNLRFVSEGSCPAHPGYRAP
jgi:hypothetical protein